MGNLTVAFKIKMCISIIQQFLKKYWVAQPLSTVGETITKPPSYGSIYKTNSRVQIEIYPHGVA